MTTFSTRDTIKAVAALQRKFDKVYKALDEVPLSITDRGAIDTILVRNFHEQSKELIMGKVTDVADVKESL